MAVNSEAIYGTRPWKIFGAGPATEVGAEQGGSFNERKRKPLAAEDVRFTTRGNILYAFLMGWPERQAVIASLALGGPQGAAKIRNVELLGFKGKLSWRQDAAGLTVQMPPQKPCEHAVALKVTAS
jgi:alpha-L-fucosidase